MESKVLFNGPKSAETHMRIVRECQPGPRHQLVHKMSARLWLVQMTSCEDHMTGTDYHFIISIEDLHHFLAKKAFLKPQIAITHRRCCREYKFTVKNIILRPVWSLAKHCVWPNSIKVNNFFFKIDNNGGRIIWLIMDILGDPSQMVVVAFYSHARIFLRMLNNSIPVCAFFF